MTLEDFFTLTEMKDGLMAPARVEELVNVMQKEKDCVVKNVNDATRQLSTVASTIAATDSRNCLDLFIQLDGLWFINRWLQDAQNFGCDTGDGFEEELIIALLRALEKLHIGNERSISSGIWITVKNLIGHKSSMVQDHARTIFGNWLLGDKDEVTQNFEKVDGPSDAAMEENVTVQESVIMDVTLYKPNSTAENHAVEAAIGFQGEKIEAVQIQKSNDHLSSHSDLNPPLVNGGSSIPLGSSFVLNSGEEKLSVMNRSPSHLTEGTVSNETSISLVSKQDNFEEELEFPKWIEMENDANHTGEIKTLETELVATDISSVSSELESRAAADARDSMKDLALLNKLDSKDGDCCTLTSSQEPKRKKNDFRSTLGLDAVDQGGECCSSVLQEPYGNECRSGENENPDSSSSQTEGIETVNRFNEEARGRGENSLNASTFFKPERNTINCRLADMELEYGLVDALEVARKVAKEVAQEVVHYKDSFCSSSSEKSSGGIGQTGSPGSINGKQDQFTEGPPSEVPSGQKASLKEGDQFTISQNVEAKRGSCIVDVESSQVAKVAQGPEVNVKKGLCDFDLNQDVCSEEITHTVYPTTGTISVVSASRPAAGPGLPLAPLQFEGTLGWKGSAATSAFRSTFHHKTPDGQKFPLAEGFTSCSKQRRDFLDIDLNVAEGAGNEICNSVVAKQASVAVGLSSGESSVELSLRKSQGLNLDLNSTSDDGDALPLFCHRNGHQSPSPASSSSAQPTLRNIDLNGPSFANDSSDNRNIFGKPVFINASAITKPDDPVISLMGMRLEVSKKEFAPQTLPPLQNGKVSDPATHTSLGRMGSILNLGPTVPPDDAQPLKYGFNGLSTGPSVSLPSNMYRPSGSSIPYMVDSRGSPFVHQIAVSTSVASPSHSQTSFFMSQTRPPPGLNGVSHLRPSFDLNSGLVAGGSRDSGGIRQFFSINDSKLMEERIRGNSPACLSLGFSEKRKEPEAGWEPYPFVNKLQQPPWR